MPAGSLVLPLFATPLNALVLRALADGPMRLAQIREATAMPPRTTLRDRLDGLVDSGAVERRAPEGRPSAVEHRLTPFGLELLSVADLFEAWLARAPGGPIPLDGQRGKEAVKALVAGWEAAILHAVAAGPVSLIELNKAIGDHSYPTLERRLRTMRASGLVEVAPSEAPQTFYVPTDWTRHAVAPLAAAARCERRHLSAMSAPVSGTDIETAFLLTLPLARLSQASDGECVLGISSIPTHPDGKRSSGIWVQIESGRPVACTTELRRDPPSPAIGTAEGWLEALIDGDTGRLRTAGADPRLPLGVVESIRIALFGP